MASYDGRDLNLHIPMKTMSKCLVTICIWHQKMRLEVL
jgi:hypothetical protein